MHGHLHILHVCPNSHIWAFILTFNLELSPLSPDFFPELVFNEFHSLAFDPLGLLGVALPLILDLDLG